MCIRDSVHVHGELDGHHVLDNPAPVLPGTRHTHQQQHATLEHAYAHIPEAHNPHKHCGQRLINTGLLFFATALAEIIGCFLPYLWLRKEGSPWLLLPAASSLAAFVWLLTLHPAAVSYTHLDVYKRQAKA